MSEVNNFITDLLDNVPRISADSLFLACDEPPQFSQKEVIFDYEDLTFTEEELMEDLAAIGFTEWKKYYYQHSFAPAQESFFIFSPYINPRGIKTVVFSTLDSPTVTLRNLFTVNNPVTAEDFRALSYSSRGSLL